MSGTGAEAVVRRLDPDDWAALRSFRLAALADAPGNFFRSLAEEEQQPPAHWQAMLADPATAVFGLYEAGTLIGISAAVTDRDDPTGRTAWFGMTAILPTHRGRGLARLFYAARLDWARERGMTLVKVSHRAANLASAAAMRRAGFVEVARVPHRWPDGRDEDDVEYELRLR